MEPYRSPVYQTLFGILRISRSALNHLLPIRQGLRSLPHEECPNDESFVGSVLADDGFVCRTFGERHNFFPYRTFALRRVISGTQLDAMPRDNLVHHAVLYGEEFLAKALRLHLRHPALYPLSELIEGVRIELGPERAAEFAAEASASV